MTTPGFFYYLLTGAIILFIILAAFTSFQEKEKRAAMLLFFFALILSAGFFLPSFIEKDQLLLQKIISASILLITLLLFLPLRNKKNRIRSVPIKRYHEEDAVLSRRLLQPGTEEYENYYKNNPDKKKQDDLSREKPGLLNNEALYYDAASFHAAEANFLLVDHLHTLSKLKVSADRIDLNEKNTAEYITWWMKQSGAHSVGFTELKDYHLYSHKGRGEDKGEIIVNKHRHAIAITVEMDHELLKYAPAGPTVMESSRKYLDSGILASKLTIFIKSLGYDAKAHIDGNYEVICPLVAADAGLGVIGRMGLLMTPDIGPRVRIAVVTTNFSLQYKTKEPDLSPIDFCMTCKKCADACPVKAIPSDDPKLIDGALRWRINSEKCYHFWTIAGTDCGQCMISCPYSHPDNWFHALIRWGIKNNLLFRRMAVKLDDVFYGRKQRSRKLPDQLTLDRN